MPSSSRLPADIIPCIQYRKYTSFAASNNQRYISGIKFYTKNESRAIINYPKLHYENGAIKNGETRASGWYKPAIRIFKNARNRMVDQKLITPDIASSYYIENLLHNVPDNFYGVSYKRTFVNIVEWLSSADLPAMRCQNGQVALFGRGEEQWKTERAAIFIQGLKNLWNGWE